MGYTGYMGANITFYGAAGGVTGSKHLLEVDGKKVLLDCGTFQGLPDVRARNRGFPFPPDSVDAVVISHAHIDHIGMLPLFVKRGFTGPIYATPATRDIARLMLEDAAGIEEQDAQYRAKHRIGAPDERQPLFTREDIPPVIDQVVPVPYARSANTWKTVVPGVEVKMYDAGHILGSAISHVRWSGGALVYTGDVGPSHLPLLHDPEIPTEDAGTLIMESTYGAEHHSSFPAALERLAQTIREICDRGGKMVVPAFSLGRTQSLVYLVHKLTDEGKIPRFPMYVDSPLATDITGVYGAHGSEYDEDTVRDFGEKHSPLEFRNLRYTASVEESKGLNQSVGPMMIISASGMMTAGRVVHHLRHTISDPKNAVFVTGYQAQGTLGRQLVHGAKRVDLYGDMFDVRAQIILFNEFSAHADGKQLTTFATKIPGVKTVALVHGEAKQQKGLRDRLLQANPDFQVLQPNEGDTLQV